MVVAPKIKMQNIKYNILNTSYDCQSVVMQTSIHIFIRITTLIIIIKSHLVMQYYLYIIKILKYYILLVVFSCKSNKNKASLQIILKWI